MKNKFLLILILMNETQSFRIGEFEITKRKSLTFIGLSIVITGLVGYLYHKKNKNKEKLKDKERLKSEDDFYGAKKSINDESEKLNKNNENHKDKKDGFYGAYGAQKNINNEIKNFEINSINSFYGAKKSINDESKKLIEDLRSEIAKLFYLEKNFINENKEKFNFRIKSLINYMDKNGGFKEEVLKKALEEKVWKKQDKGLSESLLQYSDIRAEISNEDEVDIPRFYEQDCYLIALAFIEKFLNKSGNEVLESELFKKLIFQNKTFELPNLFQLKKIEKDEGKIFEIKDRTKDKSFDEFMDFFKEKGIYLVLRNRKINGNFSDGHFYVVKNDKFGTKAYNERFSKEGSEKVFDYPIDLKELVFETNKTKGNYFITDEDKAKEEMLFQVFKIDENDFKYLLNIENYEF